WVYNLIPWWHSLITLSLVRWWSQKRRGVQLTPVERWLPRLGTREVLLISGRNDNYVTPEVTRKLHGKIGGNCDQPWIVPRAKHNRARSVDPIEYDRRLVEFFGAMPGAEEPAHEITEIEEATPVVVD
ncbi:MAG TPA: hypothetical protein DER64_03640, partial [Planctomycetaceae bacterium]|nr:hypothetical protein [Planctomycetaceae bacterium]